MMTSGLILIVDDDAAVRNTTSRFLTANGFCCNASANLGEALADFSARRPDLVLCDYELPDGTGLDLLARIRKIDRSVPLVVVTGHATIDLAVRSIQEGAEQFLTKPINVEALLVVLRRILDRKRAADTQALLAERHARAAADPFLGTSAAMRELRQEAQQVAAADGPVVIRGETGSGKGVLTRWLHANGPRAKEPFVDLNCAGLSRELLENELFGHERGAFTGAQAAKPGLLEVADGGLLFLDEIGDVDPLVQPRLLKVLEEKTFRRLGDVRDRSVNVRLLAATHHDLETAVSEKRFRSDLYYRLTMFTLRIPPLRERPEDVPLLARALLGPNLSLSPDAEAALRSYSWPGNVRELRNVLERARVLSAAPVLTAPDLRLTPAPAFTAGAGLRTLAEIEREHILRVLRASQGKMARAAAVLGIARSSLYEKLKRYGVDADADA